MKQKIKSMLALLLALCMLFAVAGCGDKDAKKDDKKVNIYDDVEETNSEEQQGGEQQGEEAGETSDETVTSSTSSSSGSSGGGSVSTIVPDENVIGGKSWKDVLAGMPKKLRGTTVVMYNWNPATEYTGANEVMDSFKKQTGIKVEWRTITYSTYFTKLPALIASGEGIPDMARTRGATPSFIQHMQPLDVAEFDFTDDAWDKKMMDLYTFGGKTYATTLQNTHVGSISVMFYNKSLIDKYDMEDPYKLWKAGKWNWDKYIEMCEDYVDVSGKSTASNGEGHFSQYLSCVWGISGAIGYNGKQYYSQFKDKTFLTAHQKLGDLYNKQKLFAFGGEAQFNNGEVLFSLGSAVHARRKNSYFGNLKAANTLYFVPMPALKDSKTYYQGHGEAEAYAIPKGAPNPKAVPYFLRMFLDGSNYELATYFGNKQNLEVYNWCMNQKTKVYGYGYGVSGMGDIAEGGIQVNTGAQMKSYIDANAGAVEKAIKEWNNTLKKIK